MHPYKASRDHLEISRRYGRSRVFTRDGDYVPIKASFSSNRKDASHFQPIIFLNRCRTELIFRKHKNMSKYFIISHHGVVQVLQNTTWKTSSCLSNIGNIIAADNLATQGGAKSLSQPMMAQFLDSVSMSFNVSCPEYPMRHQPRPSSVKMMVCRLFGTKPLSEPMLYCCKLDPSD